MADYAARQHTKQAEEFVQVAISDHYPSTAIDTGSSHELRKWWISLTVFVLFIVIGHSGANLLENFYYDQTNRSDYDETKQYSGTWMQAFLQNAAFPILIIPFLVIYSVPKRTPTNLPISQDQSPSYLALLVIYSTIGGLFVAQSKLYSLGKLHISYGIFTLISATQLIFSSILTAIINRTKFNLWIIISLILTTLAGAGTMSTSFGGEPDEAEENYSKGSWFTFFATFCFSLNLCIIKFCFENVMARRDDETCKKKKFRMVLEMLICSMLVSTIICLVGLLASGDFRDLEGEMKSFEKGEGAYVLIMVAQALSWQMFWVGIAGMVMKVSSVFSNVVYMCSWPIVSVLVVIAFDFMDDEFDWFKRGALSLAALGFGAYVYKLHKDKRSGRS